MSVLRSISALKSHGLLLIVSAAGFAALGWPLVAPAHTATAATATSSILSLVVLPLTVALFVNEIVVRHLTTKTLAVAGILIALAAAVRPLGAGVAGIEPMWLILIVAGRVLGSATGFVIGVSAIFASALVTGGIGPWLPAQLVAAGWVAMGAGLLPRANGRAEVTLLAIYAAVATFLFGWVMNLWFWQSLTGLQSAIAFNPAEPATDRVLAWVRYNLTTSLGFDLPRAVFTAALVAVAGLPLLNTLRRANRSFSVTPAVAVDE